MVVGFDSMGLAGEAEDSVRDVLPFTATFLCLAGRAVLYPTVVFLPGGWIGEDFSHCGPKSLYHSYSSLQFPSQESIFDDLDILSELTVGGVWDVQDSLYISLP